MKLSPLPRYNSAEAITVTLEYPPHAVGSIDAREFDLVSRWIELNRSVLEDYWNGRIAFTEEMKGLIRPI